MSPVAGDIPKRAHSNVNSWRETKNAIDVLNQRIDELVPAVGGLCAPSDLSYLLENATDGADVTLLANRRILAAGANISLSDGGSGSTLTIAATGVATNAFLTWTPDSGGNIVADSPTDTATLAGGDGIATVGTPGTDTITIDMDVNAADFDFATGVLNLEDTVLKAITTDSGAITMASHAVSILGGSDISVTHSGTTITVTNDTPNVDQNLYETFIGDSGSTTASTTTDTLDIEGGSGIGTVASTDKVTVTLDIVSLPTEGSIAPGDWIGMADITDSLSGKISFSSFEGDLSLANLDGGSPLFGSLSDVTLTSPGDKDLLCFDNASGAWIDFSLDDLASVVPHQSADYFMFWDATDGTHKKAFIKAIHTKLSFADTTGSWAVGEVLIADSTTSVAWAILASSDLSDSANISLLDTAQTRTGEFLFGTTTKITFDSSSQFIHAPSATDLIINGATTLTLKIGGSIEATVSGTGIDTVNQVRANDFFSDVLGGTAPYACTSTTLNTNLNADLLDGIEAAEFVRRDGSIPLTAAWDVGAFTVRAVGFIADGDSGSPTSGAIEYTGTTVAASSGTPTFPALFSGGVAAGIGWILAYVPAGAVKIPYWR